MNSNDKNTDYDELAEWAEHDMALPKDSATAKRGDDTAAGTSVLEGGRRCPPVPGAGRGDQRRLTQNVKSGCRSR